MKRPLPWSAASGWILGVKLRPIRLLRMKSLGYCFNIQTLLMGWIFHLPTSLNWRLWLRPWGAVEESMVGLVMSSAPCRCNFGLCFMRWPWGGCRPEECLRWFCKQERCSYQNHTRWKTTNSNLLTRGQSLFVLHGGGFLLLHGFTTVEPRLGFVMCFMKMCAMVKVTTPRSLGPNYCIPTRNKGFWLVWTIRSVTTSWGLWLAWQCCAKQAFLKRCASCVNKCGSSSGDGFGGASMWTVNL